MFVYPCVLVYLFDYLWERWSIKGVDAEGGGEGRGGGREREELECEMGEGGRR